MPHDEKKKETLGKPRIGLVPLEGIGICAGRVRGWAVETKYPDPDNWKDVDIQWYKDSFLRHWLAYQTDPKSINEESGLTHFDHACCTITFIAALEERRRQYEETNHNRH